MVQGTALSQVWLFIVAPMVGGALAAVLFRVLIAGEPREASAESTIVPEVSLPA